uniref:Small ribosomal subunit protein uS3m n=2 Tax=Orbiliaceae TaxID=47021 RepID=A0A411P1Y4_9PEZI|nr:ribosomal protein S3 [Orbilia dorsalia]QBF58426.1 ribosomal protein S3 [Orbilia dorsalia]QBM09606.1 hypothetical protein [Dactylella sp.]
MNTQILMDYIKKKNYPFFLMLTKYPLKPHNLKTIISKMKNILLNYLNRYSKKKIEMNLIRLKYIYLNSNMLAEHIAIKLITKKRSLLNVKRQIFAKTKLVGYNKYKLNKLNTFNIMNVNSLHELSFLNNNLYTELLNRIKYKFLSGIRLVVAGRLTRRNVAARSIKSMTNKGSLKNIDSSHKFVSVVTLRGDVRPNLDYTNISGIAKTGSFGVKAWTSYYS